ncbi:MAG: type II toxin-antitoxin system VapC family toxin [Deltaproteobacteria bacterium]|nr:type II toxin-antitoxin system VapC family toxin [Deltaproteobacteria bacterium]
MDTQPKIAIDSNLITYLLEAMSPGYDPLSDQLSNERRAMIRIALYIHYKIYVLPTVKAEYNRIPDRMKRLEHEGQTILNTRQWKFDDQRVEERKKDFLLYHKNKEADCRILAEAEYVKMNILLSYDKKFIEKLNLKANGLEIIRPTEYWDRMDVSPMAQPKRRPVPSTPLWQLRWWWRIDGL